MGGIQLPKNSHLVLTELPWGSQNKLLWAGSSAAGLQGKPELLPYKTTDRVQAGLKCQGQFQKWYLTRVYATESSPPPWVFIILNCLECLGAAGHLSLHSYLKFDFFFRDFSENKSSSSTERICFPSYIAGKGLKRLSDSFFLSFFF